MKLRRILHITGKMDRAGAETMIMNLYRNIDRSKYQFDFVYFTNDEGDYDKEIISLGGRIFHIAETNSFKRMFAVKKFLINHQEYNIIHCHNLFGNAFHVYAGKMAKVPYRISHSHSTNDISRGKLINFLYQKISRKIMSKFSTHYISCGQAAGDFLFPYNKKEVTFLPNSIDINSFAKIGNEEKDYWNNLFELSGEYLKIIQVGRLEEVKNHEFTLKIASELKSNNIQFKLIIVGQGNLYSQIENQIKERKLEDCVHLLGVRSDIPQLMAGSDVMIMPSLHEGFPVVLVESQSVGIPSLISDTISKEVDLNVGLIEYESLDSQISTWVNKLLKLKEIDKIDTNLRLEKISEQGFDIVSSARKLSYLYESMK